MDEPKQRTLAWFRFYHDALTDHKMIQLSNAEWGFWVKLLCLANQQDPRGSIYYGEKKFSTLYEKILNIAPKSSEKFLKKFEELGLIHFDEENCYLVITNWHKRQFESDDVSARSRESMRKKRARERLSERSCERYRAEQNRTDIKHSPEQNNVGGRENNSQSKDAFKDEEQEIWKRIQILKAELKPSWPGVGDFIGKIKKTKPKKHPGSILRALEHCLLYRPENPFAYAWKVVLVESDNYHKEDFMQKEAEQEQQLKELEKAAGNDWNSNGRGRLD